MKREPLYRNQSELKDLITVSNQALQLLLEIYDQAPESSQENFKVYFDQLYYWPSIHKVYGIKIENYEDMDMFDRWLKEQEGETKKVTLRRKIHGVLMHRRKRRISGNGLMMRRRGSQFQEAAGVNRRRM